MVNNRKTTGDSDDYESKVKVLYDLTSRIDERVKILLENQEKIYEKFDKVIEKNIEMQTKIIIFENNFDEIDSNFEGIHNENYELEQKVNELANFKSGTEFHFKNVFSIIYQVGLAIAIGFAYYLLGLKQ